MSPQVGGRWPNSRPQWIRWAAAVATAVTVASCSGPPGRTGVQPTTGATAGAATGAVLPLGDGRVTMSGPKVGYVWSCQPPNPNAPGAQAIGPWISGSYWRPARKIYVAGAVKWPSARFSVTINGTSRVIVGNRLPVGQPTGVFPVAATDPAAKYDRNPNAIVAAPVRMVLPARPKAASQPSCLNLGAIGVLDDGVMLFDALDAQGRDAVAHEVLDRCGGHPAPGGVYHYHEVSPCLLATARGPATLVGYAIDGYGIYVERDASGALLTDSALDACHGRTSTVPWDGHETRIYHYDATEAFPYTLGCFHGTPAASLGPP